MVYRVAVYVAVGVTLEGDRQDALGVKGRPLE